VDAGALGQARAVDTVPPKPVVWGVEYRFGETSDSYGDPHTDIWFELGNHPEEAIFWELFVIIQSSSRAEGWQMSHMFMPAQADPVLLAEGDLEFNPKSYFFSNHIISETAYLFHQKQVNAVYTISGTGPPPIPGSIRRAILLRRTSAAYYQHQKAWVRHHYHQPIGSRLDNYVQLLFGGEPTPLYSNVEGAHGVFAAFSTVVAEMKLIR
jgi:hypothetical protein